jgi:hypothetical protein
MAYKQKVQKGKVYLWDDYSGKWKYQYDAPIGTKEGVYEAGKKGIPNDAIPVPAPEQKIVGGIFGPTTTAGMVAGPLDAAVNALKNLGEGVGKAVEVERPPARGASEIYEPKTLEKITQGISNASPELLGSAAKDIMDVYTGQAAIDNMNREIGEKKRQTAIYGKMAEGAEKLGANIDKFYTKAEPALQNMLATTPETIARAKSLNETIDTMKAQGMKSQQEAEALHQANLAQEAKWAEQKKQDEVRSRVESVASQARHPWEPKGNKNPIVQMDADIEKRAAEIAGNVKPKVAPVQLKPRPALIQTPEWMYKND